MRHANAVLLGPVVVGVVVDSEFACGLYDPVIQGALLDSIADPKRTAGAAILRIAIAVVALHIAEDRQHVFVAPTAIAELRPGVIVLFLAAHENHAVNRARSAKQLAARHRYTAIVSAVVGFRLIEPIGGRVVDQLGKTDRDRGPIVAFPSRFEDEHLMLAVGAQPVGQNRSCRTCANNNIVKGFSFHFVLKRFVRD